MLKRVVLTRQLPPTVVERLRKGCDLELNTRDRPLTKDELLASVRGADALLCLLTDAIDGPVMDAAGPQLKVIANYAVGFNNIDVGAATKRGIPVTNTPGVLTDATADLAFALILDTVRRVSEGDRVQRQGAFPGWSPLYMLGGEITGATLGLFGFGRIAQAVARRARGFRMRIIYNKPLRADAALENDLGATHVNFDSLLAESDIISIHVPLNPETMHRFTLGEFSRMKRSAHLINTSRGPIVKEDDLATALKQNLIAGAGLDVYEQEPALDPGLPGLANVVLSPHLGSATHATRISMADMAVDNVLAVLAGKRPPNCVNPEVF